MARDQRRKRGGKKSSGRAPPILTGNAPQRTLSEYEELIRTEMVKAGLPPLTLALGLTELGPTITISDVLSAQGLTVHAIATALHVALNAISEVYPLTPTGGRPFLVNMQAAKQAAREAEGVVPDDFAVALKTSSPDLHAAARRYFVWHLCENHAYQTNVIYRVANTLVLLGLKPFRGIEASPAATDNLFKKHVGLLAYEFVLTLFGIWSMAIKDPIIDTRTLLQEGPRKKELMEPVSSVIAELSRTFDKYRVFDGYPEAQTYTGKARPCAFFSRWPLIRLNEHQFVVAAHPFLKIQIATKAITKAMALARREEGGEARTAFSQGLGRRMEAFFGELCELWRPGHHFAEYEYVQGQKSPDRIVFERHGSKEVACLFQLKTKMLLEATHFGSSEESIRRDLAGAFSETLYKTIQFLAHAKESERDGRLKTETLPLTRRVLACERFCLIGIVPDMPSVFSFPDLRRVLLEEVQAHLDPGAKEWFRQHFAKRCVWHVMDLDDFEWFLSIRPSKREIYKRVAGYIREADLSGDLIQGGTLPSNFRTYLIQKFGRRDPATNDRRLDSYVPELFALFNEFAADASRYFSLKPPSGPNANAT